MPESAFVGRQNYLNLFVKFISKPLDKKAEYILYLLGKGGVGKTKILQEIIKICDKKRIPHSGIIDFYGFEMSSRITAIANKIALKLRGYDKAGLFDNYWKLHKEFESGKIYEQDVVNEFLSSMCKWIDIIISDGKRPVLIFDTVEAIKYSVVERDLVNEWLPQLKKAVIVLSGRDKEYETIDFNENLAYFIIHSRVDSFTKGEAKEYLQKREVWNDIKRDKVCDKLFEFTLKKPLLLALSADRIHGSACSTSISPIDLVRNATVSDFEKKLVEELQRSDVIQKPEGTILPYMAHIIQPFDKELIEFLLPELSKTVKFGDNVIQSETVLKNLSELSFVKEKIDEEIGNRTYWLQDEVRFLFHKHIFSLYEIWDERRRDLSEKMIAFHNKKLEEAKEKGNKLEKQKCIARCLYHEIYLDPTNGINKFQETFQGARDDREFGYASMLLISVRFLIDFLPERERYMFDLAEGRWMRDMGNAEEAKKRFEKLLSENEHNLKRSPYLYSALGVSFYKLGNFKKALDYHYGSLKLSKEAKIYDRLHIEEQLIAQIYQKMGDRKKAIEHYKNAYDLALNLPSDKPEQYKQKWSIIANISYELGSMYSLTGNYKVGIEYCDEAIKILESLQSPMLIATAKMVRGNIYRRSGEYDKALQDIEYTIPLFKENSDYENIANAFFYQAFTLWSKGEKNNNDQILLKKSKEIFEKSITISNCYNLIYHIPQALHELSHVYWLLGLKEEARKINEQAYKKAIECYDMYCAVNCLVAKAEFDYDDHNYQNIPQYQKELETEFEQKGYKFHLFYGYMNRILGDINFGNKNYEEAKKYYEKAIYLISKHRGFNRLKSEELDKLEKKIQTLPEENALQFYRDLKSFWLANNVDEKKPEIISWVDQHIWHLAFSINKKKAENIS